MTQTEEVAIVETSEEVVAAESTEAEENIEETTVEVTSYLVESIVEVEEVTLSLVVNIEEAVVASTVVVVEITTIEEADTHTRTTELRVEQMVMTKIGVNNLSLSITLLEAAPEVASHVEDPEVVMVEQPKTQLMSNKTITKELKVNKSSKMLRLMEEKSTNKMPLSNNRKVI